MIITEPGLYADLDEVTYHRDPTAQGSLSSTGARLLLDSPAHYAYETTHRRDTPAFRLGRAIHTQILGAGQTIVEYPDKHLTPSGNASTKAATRLWEAEQEQAGKVPLSPANYATTHAIVEAVLAHRGARGLLEQGGQSEVSAFGIDPHSGIWTRARIDHLGEIAIDLKTTAGTASPDGFARAAAKYNYPVQEAHYLATLAWCGIELDRPMHFIVVEKQPPHLVAVHTFDEATRLAGSQLAENAREIYAACTESNTWPAYGDAPIETTLPSWWFNQLDEEIEI